MMVSVERVKIQGYRSIKSLDLELRSLNVLIGPNASGKSNLLDFFELLSAAAAGRLEQAVLRRGGMASVAFKDTQPHALKWILEFPEGFDGHPYRLTYVGVVQEKGAASAVVFERLYRPDADEPDGYYYLLTRSPTELRFRATGVRREGEEEPKPAEVLAPSELALAGFRDPERWPSMDRVARLLTGCVCYRDREWDTREGGALRGAAQLMPGPLLEVSGLNLAAALYDIAQRREYRSHWEGIQDTLKAAYPDFEELSFPADAAARIGLEWHEKSGLPFRGWELSDGTLRFLALACVLLGPACPQILCIDEPAAGLHPQLMRIVAEMLQHAAEKSQVLVATHSVGLVNALEPEDILVVEKPPEIGETTIQRLSREELGGWLRDFSLGDLWEMGKVGGHP